MKNQDLRIAASGVVEGGTRLLSSESLLALETELQQLQKHAFVLRLLCHQLDEQQGEKRVSCSLAIDDFLDSLDCDVFDLMVWFGAIHGGREFSAD